METPSTEPTSAEFGHAPPSAPILPATPPTPGPRVGGAILASVIYHAMVFAVTIPVSVYMVLSHQPPMETMTLVLISQLIGWPVAMTAGVLISRRSWRSSFAIRSCPAGLLPGLVLGCFGLSFVLNRLASQIPMPKAVEAIFKEMVSGNPAISLFCLVILAPLTEELFFRGWMLRGFAAHYSKNKSIWLTAIIFALFHLNPWQAVVALPLGVIFASLALKTGSLVPGLVGHFIVNLTGSQLLKPLGNLLGHSTEEIDQATHLPWDMVGLGALFTVVGFAWMKQAMREPTPSSATS